VVYLEISRVDVPGGIVELLLKGVLDANTFEKLDTVILDLLDTGQTNRLLINMGKVTGLSSAGAGALLSVSEQALTAGGGVVLYDVPAPVMKTFRILGLEESNGNFLNHRLTIVEARPVGLALLGVQGQAEFYRGEPENVD
jgi:anti-anti-sigma factor